MESQPGDIRKIRFDHLGGKITVGVSHRFEDARQDGGFPLMDIHKAIKDFNAEHGIKTRLIRHEVADSLLLKADVMRLPFESRFPTDALIAYEEPGKMLGKVVSYQTTATSYKSVMVDGKYRIESTIENGPRIVLPCGKHEGETDIALLVLGLGADEMRREGPDIIIDVPAQRIKAIPDFPAKNAIYNTYKDSIIPQGTSVVSGPQTRFLYRGNGPCVCPIARDAEAEWENFCRKNIYADSSPIDGILVEIPEEDVERFPGSASILDI